MKKIIYSAFSISVLLLTSCYKDDKDAKVRIYLGNIPFSAQAEKKSFIDRIFPFLVKNAYAQTISDTVYVDLLHVAVYSGDNEIEKIAISGTDVAVDSSNRSFVELSVPSGYATVLVVGEYNSDGVYANYLGFEKLNLLPGDNDVNISMKSIYSWAGELGAGSVADTGTITWNDLGIPVKYQVQDGSGNVVFEGTGTSAGSLTGGCSGFPFYIYLVFDQFGITSTDVQTVTVYDSNQC